VIGNACRTNPHDEASQVSLQDRHLDVAAARGHLRNGCRASITASAVIRQALMFYFTQIGALTPQPAQPNGQHQEAARAL
jgi:hypothetical protein